MKRANYFWMTGICAIICLPGAMHWFHTRPVHAQQSTQPYYDGTFYITASVDVDSTYNLYVASYMEVDFDDYEDIDEIEVDGYPDEDGTALSCFNCSAYGDDYDPAAFSAQSNAPVATGHEYGMESDGFACFDDGEGDCDYEPVGLAYTFVNVASSAPQISSITPSSVNEGDQGTLTINGSNLFESPGDQLTINYSGSGMPFTLTGTPTSNTATFAYNFSMYEVGTYSLSVTNNEGTSNSKTFTVNPPLNACSQSTVPNAVTLQIAGLGNGGGTFTVSHPTVMAASATTTVSYGPFSTPSSVASAVASAITRNYLSQGIAAQSNGSNVIVQSRNTFGSVSVSSSGASSSIGVPSSVSCIVLPKLPCLGLFASYDTVIPYKDGPAETARLHIIRRHISNTPSVGTTVYANNLGLTADQLFGQVQRYNQATYLLSPGTNGIYTLHFPSLGSGGYIHDLIGIDVSGNDLHSNKLVLSYDHCSVITSYPIAP